MRAASASGVKRRHLDCDIGECIASTVHQAPSACGKRKAIQRAASTSGEKQSHPEDGICEWSGTMICGPAATQGRASLPCALPVALAREGGACNAQLCCATLAALVRLRSEGIRLPPRHLRHLCVSARKVSGCRCSICGTCASPFGRCQVAALAAAPQHLRHLCVSVRKVSGCRICTSCAA